MDPLFFFVKSIILPAHMIKDLLLQRFATKHFDPHFVVPQGDLDDILECARLSCSSVNIQPWNITVISNPEIRKQLQEASYGQPQIVEASYLILLSAIKDPLSRAERTAKMVAENAGQENADRYLGMVKGSIPKDPVLQTAWLQHQLYLALQAMILAAMERGIDSCPMEGFLPGKYAEILNITNAIPTVVLAIGKAKTPGFAKIRIDLKDLVQYVT